VFAAVLLEVDPQPVRLIAPAAAATAIMEIKVLLFMVFSFLSVYSSGVIRSILM
jgi:hypothetical protein